MFSYGLFAKKATEWTNHYLDISRIGELLRTNHHYSRDEIKDRAIIIASIAVSGFLGAYFNNKEKTNCSSLTMGLAGAGFGFVASHLVVILPLIQKRRAMKKQCDEIISRIMEETNVLDIQTTKKIAELCKYITQEFSLSDDKHGRASQTWGKRISLLLRLEKILWHPDQVMASRLEKIPTIDDLLQGDKESRLSQLKEEPRIESSIRLSR